MAPNALPTRSRLETITPQARIAELEREVRVYRNGLLDIIQIAKHVGLARVPDRARERAIRALDEGPRA